MLVKVAVALTAQDNDMPVNSRTVRIGMFKPRILDHATRSTAYSCTLPLLLSSLF